MGSLECIGGLVFCGNLESQMADLNACSLLTRLAYRPNDGIFPAKLLFILHVTQLSMSNVGYFSLFAWCPGKTC